MSSKFRVNKKSLKQAHGQAAQNRQKSTDLNYAMELHRAGRLDEAAAIYKSVLESDPQNSEALHLLGVIASQSGKAGEAVALISKAIAINPNQAQYYDNLGVVYMNVNKPETAAVYHRKALEIDPAYGMAHYNLGVSCHATGRADEALHHFREAVNINPNHYDARNNLAMILCEQGFYTEAIAHSEAAIRLRPDNVKNFINMADSFLGLDKPNQSIALYEKVLEMEPDNERALFSLGVIYIKLARWEKAVDYLKRSLGDSDNKALVTQKLAESYSEMLDWDALEETRRRFNELAIAHQGTLVLGKCDPFTAMCSSVPPDIIKLTAESHCRKVLYYSPKVDFKYRMPLDGKLKIGYLSPDFSKHAVGFLLNDIFALHDRNEFEIYGYLLRNEFDEYTQTIQNSCDHFENLSRLSHADAAAKINSDGINILVDLVGHTAYSRVQIAALRPAPVQCHAIGYPGTMGADFIDYYISNEICVPPEMQKFFTEKIVYLPETIFAAGGFSIPDDMPCRAEYELPEDAFVFASFPRSYRIDRNVFNAWMEILRRTPGSVLWLKALEPQMAKVIKEGAEAQGIDSQRIIFSKFRMMSESWPMRLADLWLDTFNLSAGTASFMCAWAGLPSLTLAGDTPHSRIGACNVNACNLPQNVVNSVEEYIERAVHLANNRDELAEMKRHLIENRESLPIFDRPRYMRHLESAYRRMWDIYRSGQAPQHIHVEPLPR